MLPNSDSAIAHHVFDPADGLTERLRQTAWKHIPTPSEAFMVSPPLTGGRVGSSLASRPGQPCYTFGADAAPYGTLHGSERLAIAAWVQNAFEFDAEVFFGFFGHLAQTTVPPDATCCSLSPPMPTNGIMLRAKSEDNNVTFPLRVHLFNSGGELVFPVPIPDLDSGRDAQPGVLHLILVQADRRGGEWSMKFSVDGGPFESGGTVPGGRIPGPVVDSPEMTPDDEGYFGVCLGGGAAIDEFAMWSGGHGMRRAHAARLRSLWSEFRSPMDDYSSRFGRERHASRPRDRGVLGTPCRENRPPGITPPPALHMDTEIGQPRPAELEFFGTDSDGGDVFWSILGSPTGDVGVHRHPTRADGIVVRYMPRCGSEDEFVLRAESRCGLGEEHVVTVSIAGGDPCPITTPPPVTTACPPSTTTAPPPTTTAPTTTTAPPELCGIESDFQPFASQISSAALSSGEILICSLNDDEGECEGMVGTVSGNNLAFGPPTSVPEQGYGIATPVMCDLLSPTSFVVVYAEVLDEGDVLLARPGTISGTDVMFGPSKLVESSVPGSMSVSTISSSVFVVCYTDGSNDFAHGRARVGTVSGSDITFGAQVAFLTSAGNFQGADSISTARLDSSRFVVCYRNGNSGSEGGESKIGTISGSDAVFSTARAFSAVSSGGISVVSLSTTTFVVCYVESGGEGGSLKARRGSSPAADITYGPESEIAPDATRVSAAAICDCYGPMDKSTSDFIVQYSSSTRSYAMCCSVLSDEVYASSPTEYADERTYEFMPRGACGLDSSGMYAICFAHGSPPEGKCRVCQCL